MKNLVILSKLFFMQKITNAQLGRLTAEQYAQSPKLPIVAVLDNVRSANNVGSFFRTADSFGIRELVLCGITATPPSKDIHKTALSAELIVPWRHFTSTADAVQELRSEGYTIVAIEQVHGSVCLPDLAISPDAKYALIFGNEVDGVAQDVVQMCDMAVEIPQRGTKHSLNVAVTGGIVLWEFSSKYP